MSDAASTEELKGTFLPLLDEKEEQKLITFLEQELVLCEAERAGEESEWRDIRRQRLARSRFKVKNIPWPNASNVAVPGAKIATDTIFGMTKNSFGAKNPFWAVKAQQEKSAEDQQIARTLEKYLQILSEDPFGLNKRERDREIQEEADSLGTGFVKVLWTTEENKVWVEGPAGSPSWTMAVFHDGPEWTVFPREDAYYRMRARSIQKARWFAHRMEYEEGDLEERFSSGKWTEVENWRNFKRTEALEYEEEADSQSGGAPMAREVFDIYEVWIRWDVLPKDGFWEDLVVYYFRKAGKLVKAQVNPLGVRTIREVNFQKRAFRIDGTGVGHAALHMQEELDTIHNQRNDSTSLSGLKMFVARRGGTIKPKEVLRPGKIFFVDDPTKDFQTLEPGEVHPSSLQAENMAWMYLQKATLATDAAGGFADQTMKSRDSIGLQTLRMKASSGVIGSILEGMEDAYTDLGRFTFLHLLYNKNKVLERERQIGRLSQEELVSLEKALSISLKEIPARLRFSVRTADLEQSFEMRRQNTLTLVSLYSMFQRQMLPLVMQMYSPNPQTGQPMFPPPVMEFAARLVVGNSKLMEKVFEFFGEEQTGDFVPDFQKMELMLEIKRLMEEQMLSTGGMLGQGRETQGSQAGPGTVARPAGNAGLAGLAAAGSVGNGGGRPETGAGGRGGRALPLAGPAGSLA